MEQIKKIPQRKCVGCGARRDKNMFWRVVRTPEGSICLDTVGNKNGRGSYICKSAACLKRAIKAHRLETTLQAEIPREVYDALLAKAEENESEHE